MFRDLTYWKKAAATVAAIVVFAGTAQVAGAQSAERRKGDAVTGKIAAPTLEDHAGYFAERKTGVSPETLKKADDLRLKTIASIEALLKSKKASVRRFELLLRSGELRVERHDYLRDVEMRRFTDSYGKWEKLPADKRGKEPKLDTSGSQAELVHAVNAFRRLVTEYPQHPRSDAAFYALASTLGRMGKDTAPEYYKQLIKKHPKSPLIPDAYLALGEYYFDRQNVEEALENYKKVLSYKEHQAYPYSVYKLGWAYYNLKAKNEAETKENYSKAITAFKLVVKLADQDKNRQKRNLDLRQEAIRDLIMVWAEAADIESAWAYFKTIGDQNSFYKMLERLGNIYYEQGNTAQAIVVYRRILKESPKREGNPGIHAKLVELHDLENDMKKSVASMREMQQLYLGDTEWIAANRSTDGLVAEARKLVEHTLHKYGATYHNRGQKTKQNEYFAQAAVVYAYYLESFAEEKNAYDIRYYLAEILFDFKKYEESSKHYLIVAKADPRGKYMKPAALNAVATMNELVQSKKYPALPPAGQVPAPLEIPAEKKNLVGVIDEYIKLLPKETEGDAMRFTAAQIFFDHGHYPEALKRFTEITKVIPGTKQAHASVKVILGFHADRQDWNNLIAASRGFKDQPNLLTADLKKYVVDLLRGAMFKRAMAYENGKEHLKAAEGFIEYQKEFPEDKNADRALFNASLNFYKVGEVEKAIAANTRLLEQYPQSDLRPDVMVSLATTFESLARFERAAEVYMKFSQSYPKDQRSAGSLYNAAILYKGINNLDMSAKLLSEFLTRFKGDKIAPEAALELAVIHERRERYRDAVAAYRDLGKWFPKEVETVLHGEAKAAALTAMHISSEGGEKDLDRVRGMLIQKDAPNAYLAREIVASTLFQKAEKQFAAFKALEISDGAKVERQVKEKQERLVKLADTYQNIIAIGNGEYVVASLYRLGEAHENFANALFKAPSPKGASQADIDRFKTELEKVAFPLRDESNNFFETAYKRSKEVQTFTEWTARTYKKMVEINPEKYPAINALTADPNYLTHKVKVSNEVAELWD